MNGGWITFYEQLGDGLDTRGLVGIGLNSCVGAHSLQIEDGG